MVFDDDDFDNEKKYSDEDNPPTDECESGPPCLQAKVVTKLRLNSQNCDDEEDVEE